MQGTIEPRYDVGYFDFRARQGTVLCLDEKVDKDVCQGDGSVDTQAD